MAKTRSLQQASKFNLTQDIKAQLKALSEQLFNVPQEYFSDNPISGQALLDQGVQTYKTEKGILITVEAHQKYDIPLVVLKPRNHQQGLNRAYRKGGIIAVVNYCAGVPIELERLNEKYPNVFKRNEAGILQWLENTKA